MCLVLVRVLMTPAPSAFSIKQMPCQEFLLPVRLEVLRGITPCDFSDQDVSELYFLLASFIGSVELH